MIEFAGFALLRPVWLLALPAIAGLVWLWRRQVASEAAWRAVVDPPLLAALERLGRVVPASVGQGLDPALLLAGIAAILAVALAGPAIERQDRETFRNLDAIVIAIDLSHASVGTGRLPEALAATRIVSEGAGSRPVGLVVFAGDAYVASNFTTDIDALGTTIAALDGDTIPEHGSRPERGLALARRMIEDAGIVAADVVLVSAGVGLDEPSLTEARRLQAAGHRVSGLLISARDQDARAQKRKGALAALAAVGGGMVTDLVDPLPLSASLSGQGAHRLTEGNLAVLLWSDVGRWLILAAMAPLLLMFRRQA